MSFRKNFKSLRRGLIIFLSFCLLNCGGEQKLKDEHLKPGTHKEKILLIMDRLEKNNEYILQIYLGIIPAEIRSVDFNDDGNKDILFIAGLPGFNHQSIVPGKITLYFVDYSENEFGEIDMVEMGVPVNGYLFLGERRDLNAKELYAIKSLYEKAIDLGADVALYAEQLEDIINKHKLNEQELMERNIDEEFLVLFGE